MSYINALHLEPLVVLKRKSTPSTSNKSNQACMLSWLSHMVPWNCRRQGLAQKHGAIRYNWYNGYVVLYFYHLFTPWNIQKTTFTWNWPMPSYAIPPRTWVVSSRMLSVSCTCDRTGGLAEDMALDQKLWIPSVMTSKELVFMALHHPKQPKHGHLVLICIDL